ncbi:MAG TPA: transposase [Syntrophaceticus sp.]|nr:transposase [Syntrophaceticus sp.]
MFNMHCNALAREYGRLVAVRGEQHYCRLFKDWWCVASPLKDPEGEIFGYLDISMHAEKELGLAVAHLQTLTILIEREFSLMADCCQDLNTGDMLPAPCLIPPEVAVKLTAREHDVLSLLLSGLSSRETAAKLHLSVSTVEGYRKQIYQKLGVKGGLKGILSPLPPTLGVRGDTMSETRQRYDDEFKKNAVKLSYAGSKTVKGIAGDLGISVSLLYRWRKNSLRKERKRF